VKSFWLDYWREQPYSHTIRANGVQLGSCTRWRYYTGYTLNSTYVEPATKNRLESFVQVKNSAAKGTPAIKFLDQAQRACVL
jgi:hypothetical protein